MECGIRLDGFNDVKEGDLLEAFRIDEIQRTLS
jgi:translation initiation factor IF-2